MNKHTATEQVAFVATLHHYGLTDMDDEQRQERLIRRSLAYKMILLRERLRGVIGASRPGSSRRAREIS